MMYVFSVLFCVVTDVNKFDLRLATNDKKDRQCTYNVTLRRLRVTIVAVEKQYVFHMLIVCL